MTQQNSELTFGQRRVRLSFNPSNDGLVQDIKLLAAEFIDLCEERKRRGADAETLRLWSLAQTAIEEAAVWAVKAATA